MRKRTEEFNIKELLNIFIPKLWLIVIVAMVFGMGMAVFTVFEEDRYVSTTVIHVVKASDMEFEINDVEFANTYLQTYIEVLNIKDFRVSVAKDFQDHCAKTLPELTEADLMAKFDIGIWEPSSIADSFKITARTSQDLLTVSVETSNAQFSYYIANSIANVLVAGQTLAYDEAVKMRIVQQAVPGAPVKTLTTYILNTFIGGAVGAVLSMVAIFIYNVADVTIRDKKKIEDNFDIPVLGVIPRFISDEVKIKK